VNGDLGFILFWAMFAVAGVLLGTLHNEQFLIFFGA
jgi:hypothetical protein